MTITEYLPTLGISANDISRTLGNMDQVIHPNEYNSLQMTNISVSYFDKSQVISIQPAIKWTDGGCRPAYGSLEYGARIYLKDRIFPEGHRLFEIEK